MIYTSHKQTTHKKTWKGRLQPDPRLIYTCSFAEFKSTLSAIEKF
jgi:hypothetical protein